MTNEEKYLLKIAEFVLARDRVVNALLSLKQGVRSLGKSHYQKAVLADDLDRVVKTVEELNSIKWPHEDQKETTRGTNAASR